MTHDRLAAAAAILAIAVTAAVFGRLPVNIPIHWGFSGPDLWGPSFLLFLLPLGALFANFSTMTERKMDSRAKIRKARGTTAILLLIELFTLWWILTKLTAE